MGFRECPKCWDYYCDCPIEVYKPPVRPIELLKEIDDMNKKQVILNKKPKKYVSSYGDKVFDSLAELMKYEEEMESKEINDNSKES